MTKQDIKNTLNVLIDETTDAEALDVLSQEKLTLITDAIANELTNTVNPNGPCYPSTPR